MVFLRTTTVLLGSVSVLAGAVECAPQEEKVLDENSEMMQTNQQLVGTMSVSDGIVAESLNEAQDEGAMMVSDKLFGRKDAEYSRLLADDDGDDESMRELDEIAAQAIHLGQPRLHRAVQRHKALVTIIRSLLPMCEEHGASNARTNGALKHLARAVLLEGDSVKSIRKLMAGGVENHKWAERSKLSEMGTSALLESSATTARRRLAIHKAYKQQVSALANLRSVLKGYGVSSRRRVSIGTQRLNSLQFAVKKATAQIKRVHKLIGKTSKESKLVKSIKKKVGKKESKLVKSIRKTVGVSKTTLTKAKKSAMAAAIAQVVKMLKGRLKLTGVPKLVSGTANSALKVYNMNGQIIVAHRKR